jgi:hypothetical protein
VLDLDLLDPYLYRHRMPHELYAELREVAPVLWRRRTHVPAFVPAFGTDIEFWAVIGHKEVEQANRDGESFSPTTARLVPFPPERQGIMFVTKDPPEYNRIRRHISAGFTPRMVGRLEDQIEARNERILADARGTRRFRLRAGDRLPTPDARHCPTSLAFPRLTAPRSSGSPISSCDPRMRVLREDVRIVQFRPTRYGSPGIAVPIRVNARTDYRITDPLSRGRCDVGVGVVAVSPGIPEGFWRFGLRDAGVLPGAGGDPQRSGFHIDGQGP